MFSWFGGGDKRITSLTILHSGDKYALKFEPNETNVTIGSLKAKLAPLLNVPAHLLQVYQTEPKRLLGNNSTTLGDYKVKDKSVLLVVGEKPKPKTPYEQIDDCVKAVDVDLKHRVSEFCRDPPTTEKLREKEFLLLNEVILQNILKLDCIEVEGDARLKRKDAINKLQKYHTEIDQANKKSLALIAANGGSEGAGAGTSASVSGSAGGSAGVPSSDAADSPKSGSPAPKGKKKKKNKSKR